MTTFRQGHTIICKMETKDGIEEFSNNLQRVRIVSSIATKYPIYILEFDIESEYVNHLELYGQFDIDLEIYTTYEDISLNSTHIVKLIYVKKDDLEYKQRPPDPLVVDASASTQERLVLSCIPKRAYRLMTKEINYFFNEEWVGDLGGRTPIEALRHIITEYQLNDDDWRCDPLDIMTGDMNSSSLPRTYTIPRMTFANLLDWLDNDEFGGFYNSPSVYFFGSDVPTECFYMQSSRWALELGGPAFTFHLLPLYSDVSEIIEDTSSDPKRTFYTRVPIQVKYSGQLDVSVFGGNHTIRTKNLSTLFEDKEYPIDEIMVAHSNLSSYSFDPTEYMNPTVKEITTYNHKSIGPQPESGQSSVWARMGKRLGYIYELIVQISRNVVISDITTFALGQNVNVIAHSNDYLRYTGYHVLIGYDINIDRSNSERYMLTTKFRCARTNVAEY